MTQDIVFAGVHIDVKGKELRRFSGIEELEFAERVLKPLSLLRLSAQAFAATIDLAGRLASPTGASGTPVQKKVGDRAERQTPRAGWKLDAISDVTI